MFGLLVLVGLFVALTPGILFKLKGSKMVSAAMHAVLFAIAAYLVSNYVIRYEGFQTGPSPICPAGGMFLASTKQCSMAVQCPDGYQQVASENGSVSCSKTATPVCPDPYTFSGTGCTSTPTSCAAPYVLTNGECIAPAQTMGTMPALRTKKMPVPKKATNISYPSSVTDKNGNTISIGSIAKCAGVKGTFDITVTVIESKPSSTIIRGTERGNSRAYNLSSCAAASTVESMFG